MKSSAGAFVVSTACTCAELQPLATDMFRSLDFYDGNTTATGRHHGHGQLRSDLGASENKGYSASTAAFKPSSR